MKIHSLINTKETDGTKEERYRAAEKKFDSLMSKKTAQMSFEAKVDEHQIKQFKTIIENEIKRINSKKETEHTTEKKPFWRNLQRKERH